MAQKPLDLKSTFAVLAPGGAVHPVDVTPTLYPDLDARFDGFKGCHLVACHTFEADWPTWEIHPAGDEIVCLLSGEARMVLEQGGAEVAVDLREPGAYVIIPKATWHTARIATAVTLLFITPGEGTQNRDKS